MQLDEPILEAYATCKKGTFRDYGVGRIYLTKERLIWRSLFPWPLRLLSYVAPRQIVIDLSKITSVEFKSELWRAWVRLMHEGTTYTIRPGSELGSWFELRNNPDTTKAWFQAIQDSRTKGRPNTS